MRSALIDKERGVNGSRMFSGLIDALKLKVDSEHTELEFFVRVYRTTVYEWGRRKMIEKVEVYDLNGIHFFILDGEKLIPDMAKPKDGDVPYVTVMDSERNITKMNWSRIPLIPLKVNEQEIPLLKKVKSLQDGINVMLSDFQNNMQEDARNTILVLKNYDGTNLGEFRHNLATYGAIKIRYDGDTKGGVETLEIKVNAENYKVILEIFKKALIENAMGYDAKDDRLSGNPNQMNIQVQVIFNRDMLMNESDIITNCQNSQGILSDETIISMHPWVDDPQAEMERLEKQKQKERVEFERQYDPFGQQQKQNPEAPNQGKQGGGIDEE